MFEHWLSPGVKVEHHTRARYINLPLCTFKHTQRSPRLHSGGSFTCCNRIYVSRRREMRERDESRLYKRNVVSRSLLFTCAGLRGHVWCPARCNMTSSLNSDGEICHCDSVGMWKKIVKARERRWGVWGRLVYLLRSLLPVLVCSTPHGKCHVGEPEDLRPAPCEISPLSGDIWTPLRGFQPNVAPVFWTHWTSSYPSSFCPVFLLCTPKCTSFPITSQKGATFEIWPTFSWLISIPPPHLPNLPCTHWRSCKLAKKKKRQNRIANTKIPQRAYQKMLIFFSCSSRIGNTNGFKGAFRERKAMPT